MDQTIIYTCSICGFMDEDKATVLCHEDDCIDNARRDAMQAELFDIAINGNQPDKWFEDIGTQDFARGNLEFEYDESVADLDELDKFKIHQFVEGTHTRIFKRRKSQ